MAYMEETTPIDPAQPLPVRESTKNRRVLFIICAVAALVLIAAVLLLTPIRATMSHAWFYLTAPEEAKQLIVAGANPGEIGKFATFARSGREEIQFPVEGLVIDYAERGSVRVASVANPATMTNELYLLGDTPVALTEDRYTKTGIAISHDGSRIAYSAPANKLLGGPFFSVQPEGWTVMVMDLATREITEVGAGHGPQFIDADDASRIIYSSAGGLVLHDLDAGVVATNDLFPPLSAGYPVRISEDGSKALVFNSEQSRYGIHSVDATTLEHTLLAAIPDTFVNAVLTDTHAYWVKQGFDAPNELWSLSLKEGSTPKMLYTFSDGFTVNRVINRP